MRCLLVSLAVLCIAAAITADQPRDEESARKFLVELDKKTALNKNRLTLASWAQASNITDANLKHQLDTENEVAKETKKLWEEVIAYPWKTFKDADLKRQFQKYSVLGTPALPEDKFQRLNTIISEMQSIYAKGKICSFTDKKKCDLSLEPDITKILTSSENPEELKHVWTEWRKVSGQKVRKLFEEYVTLSNDAAVINNFTDTAEFWLEDFEDPEFRKQVSGLWDQLRPLYLQIHAYVRRQLRVKYGNEIVTSKGSIPAHLLGNMWAQTWSNVFKFTAPYPAVTGEDISQELVKQGYNPLKMFKTAEEFFTSLNLSAMPDAFWEKSILEKPKDGRELICHASAWDFFDQKDFRIKQCTRIHYEDFETAHHEMGHIQYFLQYKHQPEIYREGANSGFHEAVGDVMSLSVSSNKHLHKIGLLKEYKENPEVTLNSLFRVGLDKIVFLPFAYLMDLWRWDVFKGKITPEKYNYEWWRLRESYQGIQAPTTRSELDFDPGAKYHMVASVPYIRYFVSFVIQFQFHRSLCEKAGQYEPNNPEKALHKCDIYKSTEAGNALGNMLQMGSSKPWHDAMEVLTGQRNMDASALLEYFQPLQKWLEEDNKNSGEFIGWESDMSKYQK